MNTPDTPAAGAGQWNDQRIEIMIGVLLRVGVILAALLVIGGGALYLTRHGHQIASYRTFHGEPPDLERIPGIFHAATTGRAQGIIQLGLLVLIATPVARVLFSAIAFLKERDFMYVVITLLVLGVLLYSLFWSA